MQVAYPLNMEKSLSPRRERRRTKLIQLLQENGGASNVARLTGTQKSYFSSLVRDENPRGLGDDLAARLEQQFGKPVGWFDMPPESAMNDNLTEPRTGILVRFAYRHGIIQGGDGGFIDSVEPSSQDPEPVAYASTMQDEQAYAVKVRGNSMEPAIMQGWDVIASPSRPAQPPDLCVVYFADGRKALKRFLWQRDGLICLESLHVDHRKMTEQASEILRMDKVIAIVPH